MKYLLHPERRFALAATTLLILDVDKTLWRQVGEETVEAAEYAAFGACLGRDPAELKAYVSQRKRELLLARSRKFSMYEILLELFSQQRISSDRLIAIRNGLYHPEEFIFGPDTRLCAALELLSEHFTIAFGTNSPFQGATTVLELLGVRAINCQLQVAPIWSFERVSAFKPDPDFFLQIVDFMDCPSQHCLSVGDSVHKDGLAALSAGIPAAIIVEQAPDDLCTLAPLLASRDWEGIQALCSPRPIPTPP